MVGVRRQPRSLQSPCRTPACCTPRRSDRRHAMSPGSPTRTGSHSAGSCSSPAPSYLRAIAWREVRRAARRSPGFACVAANLHTATSHSGWHIPSPTIPGPHPGAQSSATPAQSPPSLRHSALRHALSQTPSPIIALRRRGEGSVGMRGRGGRWEEGGVRGGVQGRGRPTRFGAKQKGAEGTAGRGGVGDERFVETTRTRGAEASAPSAARRALRTARVGNRASSGAEHPHRPLAVVIARRSHSDDLELLHR